LRLAACTSIASINSADDLASVRDELRDRYGELRVPVVTLLDVTRLRFAARRARLADITLQGLHVRFARVLPYSRVVRVQRLYPKALLKSAVGTMLLPVPKSGVSLVSPSAGSRCVTPSCWPGAPRLSVRYHPKTRRAVSRRSVRVLQ
jgi:hypothetical protein